MKDFKYLLGISFASKDAYCLSKSIASSVLGNFIAALSLSSATILGVASGAVANETPRLVSHDDRSDISAPCQELLNVAQFYRMRIILLNKRYSTKAIDMKLSKFELPFKMAMAPDTGIVEYRVYSSMDIDGDRKVDTVEERCGSGYLPACAITVMLSSGKSFSEQTVSLNMIKMHGKMFGIGVLVARLAPVKASDFTEIYGISGSGVHEICNKIHGR